MIKAFLVLICCIILGLFIYYNRKIIGAVERQKDNYENFVLRYLGRHVSTLHSNLVKIGDTHNKTTFSKLDNYFDSILVNLDMKRNHVTTTGFMLFIGVISFGLSVVVGTMTGSLLIAILLTPAFSYFITVGFKFISIVKFEKKESLIMDAEDLLATDITGGGVYNAIKRYSKNFHPDIQVYFEEFLDNVQTKNMSFRKSMKLLNDRLGRSFDGFAQKSMMYEESGEESMEDMFAAIIDKNRRKRDIRANNNRRFNELRMQFIASFLLIVGYFVMMLVTDYNVRNFFLHTTFGNLLIIIDIVIVTAVMAYLASVKASFID